MDKTLYMDLLYKGYSRKQAREIATREAKKDKIKTILGLIAFIVLFILSCFGNEPLM